MAVYTKTPEEYWDKSYDHFGKILKILDKIYTESYKPVISQIYNKMAKDKVCEQFQEIYTLIDIYMSIHIGDKLEINKLLKIFLDLADKINRKIAVRFSIYVSVYIIKFYSHTGSYDKFAKTVYQKIKEFIIAPGNDLYFIDSELNNYLKYLDEIISKKNNNIT
nr:hypothetical protein [Mimivirus sp.]